MDWVSRGLLFVIRRLRMGNLAFRGSYFSLSFFIFTVHFSGVIPQCNRRRV